MKLQRLSQVAAGVGVLTIGTLGILRAADHLDPAPRVGSPVGNSADIADIYAWNTGTSTVTDNLVIALTFGGPVLGTEFNGDRDVLYAVQIDNEDIGLEPNVSVFVRFAQNSENDWGVQFTGIPGTTGPVEGLVGNVIDLGGASLYAGVRDDPFFFDLEGFNATVQTGDIRFDPERDFFAGNNVSAIVMELPLRVLPGDGPYRVWATTGRI